MTTYAIGDIQGCYHSFMRLLSAIDFDTKRDTLWLVGDIVNRGTGSLDVLRWCYANRDCIKMVLGNHDLHTIAAAHGIKKLHRSDTIQEILAAEDCDELLTWLRQQPLLYAEGDYVMVHAGILPAWTLAEAQAYAQEVEAVLKSDTYLTFLTEMYGNKPRKWDASLTGIKRLRFITNVFTRMRVCDADGGLDYGFKGELKDIPAPQQPWFAVSDRKTAEQNIFFGHWSALGLHQKAHLYALDTGCLWGRELTAMCLETKAVTQVTCDVRDVSKTAT